MRPSPSHPRSVSHSLSLNFVSPFHWLHGIAIVSFWTVPILWDLLPVRLHCVISGPRFPRSVVLLSLLREFAMAAFVIVDGFVWFCLTAISILRMIPGMIQCYHTLSVPASLLGSWSPCPLLFVLFLFVLGFVCGWFVSCSASLFGVWFFLLASWQLVGLCTGPASVHFCSSPS